MLSNEIIEQLISSAKVYAPAEMCGLLCGDRFYQTPNIAEDPCRSFVIDHRAYIEVCAVNYVSPWAIVHSHPGNGACPSLKDCQLMDALQLAGQDLAMVIVGLQPVEIRCFKKRWDLYWLEWMHTMYDPERKEFLCHGMNEVR